MNDLKTRSYTDSSQTRTTLRFDVTTWRAIDQIAADRGLLWHQWVNTVPVRHENRHTDVRSAVMAALVNGGEGFERKKPLPVINVAPLLLHAEVLDDSELDQDVKSQLVDAELYDFGGFILRVGTKDGRPCVWIVNGMRGGRHVSVPIPEWVNNMPSLADLGMPAEELK